MKAKKRIRVTHLGKPAEPWGKEGEAGQINRATPGGNGIPAQAFVDWGEYATWEPCSMLQLPPGIGWDQVRKARKGFQKSPKNTGTD